MIVLKDAGQRNLNENLEETYKRKIAFSQSSKHGNVCEVARSANVEVQRKKKWVFAWCLQRQVFGAYKPAAAFCRS